MRSPANTLRALLFISASLCTASTSCTQQRPQAGALDAPQDALAFKSPDSAWILRSTNPSNPLYPLGHLGLAVECLFFEALQARGHIRSASAAELSALPSSRREKLRTLVYEELGQNLYDRYPWTLFAARWNLANFKWQQGVSGLFDPLQIYAGVGEWTAFAERLHASSICRPKENSLRGEWDQGIVFGAERWILRARFPRAPEPLSDDEWLKQISELK